MRINGTSSANPIFLVDRGGNYLMDSDGSYTLFDGEAYLESGGLHLVDGAGNYLVDKNGAYLDANGVPDPVTAALSTTIVQPAIGGGHTPTHLADTANVSVPWLEGAKAPQEYTKKKTKDNQSIVIIVLGALLTLALVILAILLAFKLTSSDEGDTPAVEETHHGFTPLPTLTPYSSQSTDEEENDDIDPPAEAFEGAGEKDIPVDAQEMRRDGNLAIIQAPSGNITCAFGGPVAECRVHSWFNSSPYGNTDGMSNAKVTFSSKGEPSVAPVSDALDGSGYTLPYGSSAYSDDWVCGSSENGITCWNTNTGHGAFINRDGYIPF